MAVEPELVRTSLRRAAASTSPSLGRSRCRLTSPPLYVSSGSQCSAAMAIPARVSSFLVGG
eukprot:4583714-Pyramimonas_sp.AAC.1